MRVPGPMRLGPSIITPGPTSTSGARSTSGANLALGSMGIDVVPPVEFSQRVIFQIIITAALPRQGEPQGAFAKALLEKIEVQEGEERTPAQFAGPETAALYSHFPGRQARIAVLAGGVLPEIVIGIMVQRSLEEAHRPGHFHLFVDLPLPEPPRPPAKEAQGVVRIPAQPFYPAAAEIIFPAHPDTGQGAVGPDH